MGLLCDYFSAPTDEMAATTIDRPGGPAAAFPTAPGNGIEPFVHLGTLEALLTGQTYEDVEESQAEVDPVAMRDDGEGLVVRLTEALVEALTFASDARLTEVAQPWAMTEEFGGAGDSHVLTDFLRSLQRLAQQARNRHEHLYCWLVV